MIPTIAQAIATDAVLVLIGLVATVGHIAWARWAARRVR